LAGVRDEPTIEDFIGPTPSSRLVPRLRYLGWAEYGDLLEMLAKKVASHRPKFDLVIGIARGGVPVAMVVSDRLGAKVDFINVKSYDGIGRRSKPRILTTITQDIRGERVLLVDDIVDGGDTMKTVSGYLRTKGPEAIRTAAIFTKPWSSVVPDFTLGVTESWVVFPYERGEVKRLIKSSPVRK
jgi:hypoxanthine phosphoribosyltransferase